MSAQSNVLDSIATEIVAQDAECSVRPATSAEPMYVFGSEENLADQGFSVRHTDGHIFIKDVEIGAEFCFAEDERADLVASTILALISNYEIDDEDEDLPEA